MNAHYDLRRPYLVIPKLVEQPTWGGQYIAETKGWDKHGTLGTLKIGQSYELFSGSNLSLLDSSEDPQFRGELTDRDAVATQTHPPQSVALSKIIASNPDKVLGVDITSARGPNLNLLIKYTQALGNSFQAHTKDGVKHPKWLPKPESWYYFEPGLITLGAKAGIDWDAYRSACVAIQEGMAAIGAQVKSNAITFADAKPKIKALLDHYDPWQYVNTVPVGKDQIVDLSAGGLHHSWEEDSAQAPLGNVLYELQAEALDAVSTFRSFDKGKMGADGSVRSLQINEYFEFIDRKPAANDPARLIREPSPVRKSEGYSLSRLMTSHHYSLDKLTLKSSSATFDDSIHRFMHLFVQGGSVAVTANGHTITVAAAHSCFIPAAAEGYAVKSLIGKSEILMSY